MAGTIPIPSDYWKNLQTTPRDVEFLHNYLFEREMPLTAHELVSVLIGERVRHEQTALVQKHTAGGKTYLPQDSYQAGDELIFPALNWRRGTVTTARAGVNPAVGEFNVISVAMAEGEERMFASSLADHSLNRAQNSEAEEDAVDVEAIVREYGQELEDKIEAVFEADDNLVQIAGRWFPRALLVDVNVGHLNLAEAVLDMSGGEPQPAAALLKDVELPAGVNPKLAEFSLNLALQEDDRFDEVGPAGEILWCLRRLEPQGVREVPTFLRYTPIEHDRSKLTPEMLALESQLDDELSPLQDARSTKDDSRSYTFSLIYPHLRAGTLPLSARARKFFPTAYESPRVRFTIVDGKTGARIPAWVVRTDGYVYGLREWYKSHALIPGSLVEIKHSEKPGEVIVEAKTQRSTKDWVRTLMVGADGGMVFAMLKQPITAEFNDRMAIFVPDFGLLDPLWSQKRSFEDIVVSIMRELTKLTPQGHVHAQELYAAVNLVRRVPPAPLLALLANKPFAHVGDLHFRLGEEDV